MGYLGIRSHCTRSVVTREIVAQTPSTLVPNTTTSDSVHWTLTRDGQFSAISAWQALRVSYPTVPWAGSVWFPHHVPRWAFIVWIAFLGRLSTMDILCSWGLGTTASCSLCLNGVETHEHLFFSCPYSKEVWQVVLSKNHITRSALGLLGEIDWVCSRMSGASIRCRVYKLSLAASIYWIWRERNNRVFQGKSLPAPLLSSHIIAEVRACLYSWRGLQRTDEARLMSVVWGLSSRIFSS
ncbi:hypothetical protein RHGRI_001484 [Rhododendron griersonianum]|uniref:Reverse transcriptase zinc-binding domain-containing protein n=2 Tax=Rhododendron griersonianum TaxID=479676 RepID=A0AAV6LKB1_9ERIC|nr:hypothetical protein RHGRI_001484 [Rhododendron griersonianum]